MPQTTEMPSAVYFAPYDNTPDGHELSQRGLQHAFSGRRHKKADVARFVLEPDDRVDAVVVFEHRNDHLHDQCRWQSNKYQEETGWCWQEHRRQGICR
jgi:hypothetical protein